ncbi:MAG: NAD(P)-dependent alcohol dehydrogenase [Cytophagales bacterium]|nr:NAD(P)-dependent alcohol dehydrogenase [Cytophagales bacterium]
MKAVIYKEYGPPSVLKMVKVRKPKPQSNEILIKVYSTSVTSGDVRLRSSDFPPMAWLIVRLIYGLFKPKKQILGHEFSGLVEEIGKDVTKYKVGDEVIGTPTMLKTGTYTEYLCIPEERKKGILFSKPKNLSFNEAATIPVGGITALCLLQKAGLSNQQSVLIYGATGSVGSYAVQIAKEKGAKITAVCSSPNFEMARSLGADLTIDYRTQDYTSLERKYDIVFDAVGKTSKSIARKVLKEGGHFVTVKSMISTNKVHLKELSELAAKGKIKPYLDKCFPFSEIVAAHKYVENGHKRGNVAIEIVAPDYN